MTLQGLKSDIFVIRVSSNSMLVGLTSLWMTGTKVVECILARAFAISVAIYSLYYHDNNLGPSTWRWSKRVLLYMNS